MTTSGAVAQTTIPVIDIIDHSILRCGIEPAKIDAEKVDIAKNNLFYYLMYLANKGVMLWTVERILIGLLQGQATYSLPPGTIDLLQLYYRTLTIWTGALSSSAGGNAFNANDQNILTYCVQTSPDGNISADFGSTGESVTTVGIMPYGNNTYTLVWEYSYDNTNWTTAYSIPATSMLDGQWYYYDIYTPVNAEFFRVRETGGATLSVREIVFAWNPTEIRIGRNNLDDYSGLPNKTFQSEYPTQFWLDRQLTAPIINIWPSAQNFTIMMVAWCHRQVQDIGDLTNTLEVPQRWYDCILANLAHRNSLDMPDVEPDRIDRLERLAMKAEEPPYDEERDKAAMFLTPNITYYTGSRGSGGRG